MWCHIHISESVFVGRDRRVCQFYFVNILLR